MNEPNCQRWQSSKRGDFVEMIYVIISLSSRLAWQEMILQRYKNFHKVSKGPTH